MTIPLDNPDLEILVCYHYPCMDGSTAAAVALKKFPRATLHPLHVQDIPKHLPVYDNFEHILFVDISPSLEVYEELAATKNVCVLDHHKTAMHLKDKNGCFIANSSEDSGASLTWKMLFGKDAPWVVELAKDYDTWTHKYLESKYFANIFNPNVDVPKNILKHFINSDLASSNINRMIEQGEIVNSYMTERILDLKPTFYKFQDLNIATLNFTLIPFVSEVGAYLANLPEADLGIVWYHEGSRGFKYSVRSLDTKTDASEFCKQFDGGGHRNAAGFYYNASPEFIFGKWQFIKLG